MGQIRRRGNRWWIRYSRNGKRYDESSGSVRKGDAVALLKLREGDIAKGVAVTPQIGRLRFDEAAGDVVADYKVNGQKSIDSVERRIRKHLLAFFGGYRMTNITTADIRVFIARRKTPMATPDGRILPGASNAEINRELAILKRAFRLAQQAEKLIHRPHIPMLKEDNVRQGFFERAEFDDVRSKLPDELRGVVTLAYFAGWRIASEVLPLKWTHVDRAAKTVRLDPGHSKNGEGRTLPCGLLPELWAVIDTQWSEHERLKAAGVICPSVFHRNGKPIRHFRKAWAAACVAAGVPGKLLHDFRRTAVRNLVRAGVPEATAMRITGHKTRSVFDRYDIVNEADLSAAMGRLAGSGGTDRGQSGEQGRISKFARGRN